MKRMIWITVFCMLGLGISRLAAAPPYESKAIQLVPHAAESYPPVITAIAMDPRGQCIAVSGDDHIIRILRRSDLQLIETLTLHADWVRSLDFSPDGQYLVSAAHDGRLILWDRDGQWRAVQSTEGAPALRCVRFSPDGTTVAAVGFAPELHLMGVGDDRRPKLNCGCRDLRAVAYRGDSLMLAAAGRSGDVHLFDALAGSSLGEIQLHRGRIRAMQFIGATGRIITAGEDGHAIVYDTDERRVIHDVVVPGGQLHAACMIDDVHVAVGGSDNVIRIFNVETGEPKAELKGHTGSVASMVAIGGDLYSGGFDTTLRLWRLQDLARGARVAEAEPLPQPEARTSRLPQ